jgi:pimeloyl-ACP methyl ester carboxylesterase
VGDTAALQHLELDFDELHGGPQKAVVLIPRWGGAQERFPLLVALHGRGESNRGLSAGAWGWAKDYRLGQTMHRMRHPLLGDEDLAGLGTPAYLADVNERIRQRPLRGLVVVCPYTPDILGTEDLDAAEPFTAFVTEHLLPAVRARCPVLGGRQSTGIDGVSLGGRVALLAAMDRPDEFRAVGSVQAAIRIGEVGGLCGRASQAWAGGRGPEAVRLLTSDEDPFAEALHKLAVAMGTASIPVHFHKVPGPHDYSFNRGPGGLEMLLWHDSVLRGEQPSVPKPG